MVPPYTKQQPLPGHWKAVKSRGKIFQSYNGYIDPAGGDIGKQGVGIARLRADFDLWMAAEKSCQHRQCMLRTAETEDDATMCQVAETADRGFQFLQSA